MTAACGLPWLTLMGRPGSLAVFLHCKCWPTSDSFFVSTTTAHLSELCECPVLPLVESGKHYRISLENLLKPAQNSSTFRGSSLVSYCKFIHTENLALYSSYWCDLFFFFHTWAAPEIPLSFPSLSSSSVSSNFLYRDSTEGHPFPVVWIFCSPLFDVLTFSVSPVYFSPENVVYFSYNRSDGTDVSLWLTFVPVSLFACKRNKQILKTNPPHVFSITFLLRIFLFSKHRGRFESLESCLALLCSQKYSKWLLTTGRLLREFWTLADNSRMIFVQMKQKILFLSLWKWAWRMAASDLQE